MKLSKCESGHFYDSDKYPECPYCNTELLKDHSIVHEGEAEQPAAVDKAAPAGPVAGWLVVLDGVAKGRDLRLGIGRSFLGLDTDGYLKRRRALERPPGRRGLRRREERLHAAARFLPGTLLPGRGCPAGTPAADRRRSAAPGRCRAAICAVLRCRLPLVRGLRHDK